MGDRSAEIADLLGELCSTLPKEKKGFIILKLNILIIILHTDLIKFVENVYKVTITYLNSLSDGFNVNAVDELRLLKTIKEHIRKIRSKEECELYQGLHERLFNNVCF